MSDLRAQFLQYNPFRSKEVTVDVPRPDGTTVALTVVVRQCSVEERTLIFSDAKVSKSGEVSVASEARSRAQLVIHLCRNPKDGAAVFTAEDLPVLVQLPSGSWLDTLAIKCMEVISEGVDEAKKE